jgi:hypothetical protein
MRITNGSSSFSGELIRAMPSRVRALSRDVETSRPGTHSVYLRRRACRPMSLVFARLEAGADRCPALVKLAAARNERSWPYDQVRKFFSHGLSICSSRRSRKLVESPPSSGQSMGSREKRSVFFRGVAGPFSGLIACRNPEDSLSLSLFHWLYIKSTHSLDNLFPSQPETRVLFHHGVRSTCA